VSYYILVFNTAGIADPTTAAAAEHFSFSMGMNLAKAFAAIKTKEVCTESTVGYQPLSHD
jgi:hypothetical protein